MANRITDRGGVWLLPYVSRLFLRVQEAAERTGHVAELCHTTGMQRIRRVPLHDVRQRHIVGSYGRAVVELHAVPQFARPLQDIRAWRAFSCQLRDRVGAVDFVAVQPFADLAADAECLAISLVWAVHADRFCTLDEHELITL